MSRWSEGVTINLAIGIVLVFIILVAWGLSVW